MSRPTNSYIRGQVEVALAERLARAQLNAEWERWRWRRAAQDYARERARRQRLEVALQRIASMGCEEAFDHARSTARQALEGES